VYRIVQIREYEVGLLYRSGRFAGTLEAGRHRVWSLVRHESVAVVDTRRTSLAINGQEMLTADKIALRLNLMATYRVVDAEAALHRVVDYRTQLYNELQLAVRSVVSAASIDALMAEKVLLSETVRDAVLASAAEYGIEVESVGIKDIVLPADVKRMLAQEAEAERYGRAALVTARSETAATRSLLNAAKLLADHPALLRLREMQSLVEMSREGSTIVTIPQTLLTALSPNRDGEEGVKG
jgi:regulator of protease activity HflC (stomatin/prohibitin superfamily)